MIFLVSNLVKWEDLNFLRLFLASNDTAPPTTNSRSVCLQNLDIDITSSVTESDSISVLFNPREPT